MTTPHPLALGPIGYGVFVVVRAAVLCTITEFARAVAKQEDLSE
jgi:hypothetical protein